MGVNGTSDYDYSNATQVLSNVDDWDNYPNFQGLSRLVNVEEWTDPIRGDEFGYLSWWYEHLPHFAGRGTDFRLNNWWRYFVDLNHFKSGLSSLALTEGQPVVHAEVPSRVTGIINLTADAFVDGALGRVDFYFDGIFQQVDALAPFTFQRDATTVIPGHHVIEFRGYDLQNQTEGTTQSQVQVGFVEIDPPKLELIPTVVTWIKNQPPVPVLSEITASGANLQGGTLTLSLNASVQRKKVLDHLVTPSHTELGTSNGQQLVNGMLTLQIQLKPGTSTSAIQSFLRGILFSTSRKGLKTPTRQLNVTLARLDAPVSTISQTIQVRKK